jgi:NADH-quinone oxidoreductase subunit H
MLPAIPGFDVSPAGSWAYTQGETGYRVLGYIAQVAGVHNFILKAVVGVTVMMWVRWTLPRLRIDQVMTTCLKYCVPLAAFCFIGAVMWKVLDWPSPHDFAPQTWGRSFAETRENWVLVQNAEGRAGGVSPLSNPPSDENSPAVDAHSPTASDGDHRTTLAKETP